MTPLPVPTFIADENSFRHVCIHINQACKIIADTFFYFQFRDPIRLLNRISIVFF